MKTDKIVKKKVKRCEYYEKNVHKSFSVPYNRNPKKKMTDSDYISTMYLQHQKKKNNNQALLKVETPSLKEGVKVKEPSIPQVNNEEGISICLSAWNTQDYIEECLDSIAAQTWFKTHGNWEILLGIDACEKTLAKVKEIMHKYKNLSVYMMDENVGTYVTCNTIMKLAKYEWLLRFDTDDVMMPTFIEDIFRNKLDTDILRYSFKNFGERGGGGIAYGSHMLRKEVFLRYGGYRNWRVSGDYDLIYRLEGEVRIKILKNIFYKRRVRNNSLEFSKETNKESSIRKELNLFVKEKTRSDKNIIITTASYSVVCEVNPIITFIIPNRGGTHVDYVINNIKTIYKNYNYEIIVIEQKDEELFKKGQLYNIAISFSNGTYIALCDNDIIHFTPIDLIKEYEMFQKPYLGFEYISQCKINNNKPVITTTAKNETGGGAFLFAKKTDLLDVNGFSNLYLGWGCEDNEIVCRLMNDNEYRPSIRHIKNTIGHITHVRRINEKIFKRNQNIFRSRNTRKQEEDGLLQTRYTLLKNEVKNNVRYIDVTNIGVCENFIYQEILKK